MKKKRLAAYGIIRQQVRDCLEISHLETSSGFIPGSRCVIATVADQAFPVGTVWYSLVDAETCFTQTSYVEPWARRLGVRTRINEWLIDSYPALRRIVTGNGISKASRKWMKGQGYKRRGCRLVLKVRRRK